MVSEHQRGNSNEYKTDAHKFMQTKPKHMLLSIKPMTEEHSREWLGAANELDMDQEIINHFATQVKLNKEREND